MSELREQIARIVDPSVWDRSDRDKTRRSQWATEISPGWGDITFEQWTERGTETSLAKADAILAAVMEEGARVCEARAVRGDRARGGMGQILANTQDREARAIAAELRALKGKP